MERSASAAPPANPYRRTPLPKAAHKPMVLVIPLWMLLIFSPFVAFTVNGKVDDSNWTPAFVTAGFCIAALAAIALRQARTYRALPKDIRDEYRFGRLIDRDARVGVAATGCAYRSKSKGADIVELNSEGVVFAPSAMVGASFAAARQYASMNAFAHIGGAANIPAHRIPWSDITEWQVHEDSDNPDFYRLMLRDGGHVELRRPHYATSESPILDFVRKAGQRPVRLFCDVD